MIITTVRKKIKEKIYGLTIFFIIKHSIEIHLSLKVYFHCGYKKN